MTWSDVAEIASSPGFVVLFPLAVLWTGMKGKWIWGWVHDKIVAAERERADEWKQIALGTLAVGEKAVSAIEKGRG